MVGDFMVCVDRIIASACFDASGAGETGAQAVDETGEENKSRISAEKKRNSGKSKNKAGGEVVECRICQEEGEESDMESPCACTGTLKVNFSLSLCARLLCVCVLLYIFIVLNFLYFRWARQNTLLLRNKQN